MLPVDLCHNNSNTVLKLFDSHWAYMFCFIFPKEKLVIFNFDDVYVTV